MDQQLRLFIAIDLPQDVKRLLGDVQAQLRQHTQAVSWPDPNGTHLTLKFLGNVHADSVASIVYEMQSAATLHRPFELQTEALGVFPNLKRPRVLWLGVGGDRDALQTLQADIEQAIAPLGFPPEKRPFSPHLTLGRSLKDPTPQELTSISRAVQQTKVLHSIVFSVVQIVLMRSELLPQGARYTPIAHAPLDGRA